MGTIDTTLIGVVKDLGSLTTESTKMRTAVFGNGNPVPGLSERMNVVERWREGLGKTAWTVLKVFLSILGTVIAGAILYYALG